MRVYIEITGHIKNHQNFKILFWSQESKKQIFTIFQKKITKKWAGNLGISSETTWESRVRRPENVIVDVERKRRTYTENVNVNVERERKRDKPRAGMAG